MRIEQQNSQKIFRMETIDSRSRGGPRKRWIQDVEEDLRNMRLRRWRRLCNAVSYTHLDVYKRQLTLNITK